MFTRPVNSFGASPCFKGNSEKNNKKRDSSPGFIAVSALIGAGIGAANPDRLCIQNSSEVTKDSLKELLENIGEYSKTLGKKAKDGLAKNAQSALDEFQKLGKKNAAGFEVLQTHSFEKLKPFLPKESRWTGGFRGGAIGFIMGTGLVAVLKFLEASRPPADIEVNPFEQNISDSEFR